MVKDKDEWEEDVVCEKMTSHPKKKDLYKPGSAGAGKWRSNPLGSKSNNPAIYAESHTNPVKEQILAAERRANIPNAFRDRKWKQEDKTDWSLKYMAVQKEMAEDAAKWNQRFSDLETVYKKQMSALQEEFEQTLEEGYAEAYEMLCEQRDNSEQRIKQLEAELATYKANTNYQVSMSSSPTATATTNDLYISER